MKMQKSVILVKKLKINMWNIYIKKKNFSKVKDYCHYTEEYRDGVHSIYNLKYSIPKKLSIAFHNGSNYDYHFIIKELAEEFKS